MLLAVFTCFAAFFSPLHVSSIHQAVQQSEQHDKFDFVISPENSADDERKIYASIGKHDCGKQNIKRLLDLQYYSHGDDPSLAPHEFFSKHTFLSHLRNKTVVILGDSLGLQMFYSLDAALISERTSISIKRLRPKNSYNLNRGVLTYEKYNASLIYRLGNTFEDAEPILNSSSLASADLLQVAIGAWYKPGFRRPRAPPNLTAASAEFHSSMRRFRDELSRRQERRAETGGKPLRVIWQLSTRMGPSDDERFKHVSHGHGNGSFWDQCPHEAEWVPVYNELVREVAAEHGDGVLDTYSVSRRLLQCAMALRWHSRAEEGLAGPGEEPPHAAAALSQLRQAAQSLMHGAGAGAGAASSEGVNLTQPRDSPWQSYADLRVHSDSLHFCQGGVFRAAGLVLQKLLGRIDDMTASLSHRADGR